MMRRSSTMRPRGRIVVLLHTANAHAPAIVEILAFDPALKAVVTTVDTDTDAEILGGGRTRREGKRTGNADGLQKVTHNGTS